MSAATDDDDGSRVGDDDQAGCANRSARPARPTDSAAVSATSKPPAILSSVAWLLDMKVADRDHHRPGRRDGGDRRCRRARRYLAAMLAAVSEMAKPPGIRS